MLPDELTAPRPVTFPKFTELVVTLHQMMTFTLTGKVPVAVPAETILGKRERIMISPEALMVVLILKYLFNFTNFMTGSPMVKIFIL